MRLDLTPPATTTDTPSTTTLPPAQATASIHQDRLGTYIQRIIDTFHSSSSWPSFIAKLWGAPDLSSTIHTISHAAGPTLQRLKRSGVPILQTDAPWTQQRKDQAITRGSHPSTHAHADFLREEMADMVQQKFRIVLPYHLVQHIPSLRISPMGVVPQRERRPRVIVDFSFSGVNQSTLKVAPYEAMQFGRTFERLLHKIHHAPRRYGPVFLIKVDLSDGFYRMPLSTTHLPTLGVAFPNRPCEPPLVALPLVLPMGWVASPPYFCALTETATDLANHALQHCDRVPLHPLSDVADNPLHPTVLPRPLPSQMDSLPALPIPPLLVPRWLNRSSRSGATKPPRPLAYVDVYMDDFLGLAQGHPGLRNQVRSKLLHAIDCIFRPLATTDDSTRKQPISIKKLNNGDGKWATRKTLLGWVVDTITNTIELPPHRADKLNSILTTLTRRKRVSLRHWQQYLGELRSMILAIPGGRGLFSTLYTGLTQNARDHRVRIRKPMHDALCDLHHLARDLSNRPTRLGEIVDAPPSAMGTADASGGGMGGVWLAPQPTFPPTIWRHPFHRDIQQRLITTDNRQGTITNSDLELAAQIMAQDILTQLRDCRERTISTFTDNVSARAWHRKGSATTIGPAAYLLRLNALHQRGFRYRATIDYLPGPLNVMADDASRLWHLTDDALLAHFNLLYPQTVPWTLSHPRPEMLSALISALLCKRSDLASFLPGPTHETPIGFDGSHIVNPLASILSSPTHQIRFNSSKSLPSVTDLDNFPPPRSLSNLAPWKQRSAPLARRWPAWGPLTHGSTPKEIITTCYNNNFEVMHDPIHLLQE
jgi:hypothetical protein